MSGSDVLRVLARSVGRYVEYEARERAGKLRDPVYVIKGRDGREIPRDAAGTLRSEFDQAIYEELVAQRYLERDYSKPGECYVLTVAGIAQALE